MNTNATNGNERANLHSGLNVQLVRRVFEDFKNIGIIRTFGGRGKSKRKLGFEIGKYLLVCIGRGMMCLVDNYVIKIVILEQFKVQCNTLNASTNNV